MRLLDHYVLRYFVQAYWICFASFLSLYVVIDVFNKIDEFTAASHGFTSLCRHVAVYYLYRLPWFFLRLSGIFSLMAATFALAWLEKRNEILPWLSAGVPIRRLLWPVLAATVGVIGLSVVNRELVIPRCAGRLVCGADDPDCLKPLQVQGCYDSNLVHIEGRFAEPRERLIEYGRVTIPWELAGGLLHINSEQMKYRPPSGTDDSGWYLYGATPPRFDHPLPRQLDWLQPGVYFLHTDVSFQRLTRSPTWFQFEPTAALFRLVATEEQCQRRAEMIALLHRRLTEPLLEFTLVLLGVPLIVGRPERNIFLKCGLCLAVYAVFQGFQYVCGNLAQQEYLDAALGAWLPVLVFGPVAVVGLDGMRS